MLRFIIRTTVFAAATLVVALASPASAIDGRTAVGVCIDKTASGARCAWSVNDKGEIDICDSSGCYYCADAKAECTAAAKGRPKPKRALPVDTTFSTPLGKGRVAKTPFSGPLLRARCPDGLRPCPLHGCIPERDVCDFPM